MKLIVDQPERCGRWLAEKQGKAHCRDESAAYIGLERKGELDVVFMYNGLTKNGSVQMHVSVDGRCNKEIRRLAFHYPFMQLNVKKIIAAIQSDNSKCIKFALNAGFVLEHIIKDAGSNGDILLFTMTKEQCRFIR